MSKRILWIDNQPEYIVPHMGRLRDLGYQVDEAWSAQDAVDVLRKRGHEYSLIIMDVLMEEQPVEGKPIQNGRTGLALHQIIREDLGLKVPMIVITVILEDSVLAPILQRDKTLQLYCTILEKPVLPSGVLEAVQKAIGRPEKES
jgi:CheY-like chemotaxis protein